MIDKSVLANDLKTAIEAMDLAVRKARLGGVHVEMKVNREGIVQEFVIYEPSPEPVSTEHVPDWDKAPHINEE